MNRWCDHILDAEIATNDGSERAWGHSILGDMLFEGRVFAGAISANVSMLLDETIHIPLVFHLRLRRYSASTPSDDRIDWNHARARNVSYCCYALGIICRSLASMHSPSPIAQGRLATRAMKAEVQSARTEGDFVCLTCTRWTSLNKRAAVSRNRIFKCEKHLLRLYVYLACIEDRGCGTWKDVCQMEGPLTSLRDTGAPT